MQFAHHRTERWYMTTLSESLGARVELALAKTYAQNWLAQLRAQWRQHAFNSVAVICALTAVFWRAAQGHAPHAWHDYANFALIGFCAGYLLILAHRLRCEVKKIRRDWLCVQPVAQAARMRWLRTRAAIRASVELFLLGVLQQQLFGENAALTWIIGGLGSALIIQFVPALAPSTHYAHAKPLSQARYASIHRPAIQAWFHSEVMTAARMRWWWMAVALLVPMSSSLAFVATLALVVAAVLRIYAVLHACALSLHQASCLLQSQPMQPSMLYRAAWRFLLQGVAPSSLVLAALLALLCVVKALSLWMVPAALLTGVFVSGSALHFAFGHRLEPLNSLRRVRMATLWCLSLALLAQMAAPILPLVCLALWRYHFVRGQRALELP